MSETLVRSQFSTTFEAAEFSWRIRTDLLPLSDFLMMRADKRTIPALITAFHALITTIPALWQRSTVTLQKWWIEYLGNAMARNMKTRPGRNPYLLVLVQAAQHLQKNDSYAFNSERKKISTSSQWPLAYVLLLLAVFWVSFGQFSQWKIDSPIFFQLQRGRHSWLWFSQSSWLDYPIIWY